MLEIFGLIFLCKRNGRIAVERGRKAGSYIGLTLGLWLGGEFFTFLLCIALGAEAAASYIFAILAAILGAVASVIITNNCAYASEIALMERQAEKPMRAAWTAIGALIFILISGFSFAGIWGYDMSLVLNSAAYTLALASCAYLLMQKGSTPKVTAWVCLFFAPFVQIFIGNYMLLYVQTQKVPSFEQVINRPGFLQSLLTVFAPVAILAWTCLLISRLDTRNTWQKVATAAVMCGIADLASSLYGFRLFLGGNGMDPQIAAAIIVNSLMFSLFLPLAIHFVQLMCTTGPPLALSVATKVWCCICIAFTLISAITTATQKGPGNMRVLGFAFVAVALMSVTGYVLLLLSKRVGVSLVLIGASCMFLGNFRMALFTNTQSVYGVLLSFAGIANPIIMWILVHKAWKESGGIPSMAVPVGHSVQGAHVAAESAANVGWGTTAGLGAAPAAQAAPSYAPAPEAATAPAPIATPITPPATKQEPEPVAINTVPMPAPAAVAPAQMAHPAPIGTPAPLAAPVTAAAPSPLPVPTARPIAPATVAPVQMAHPAPISAPTLPATPRPVAVYSYIGTAGFSIDTRTPDGNAWASQLYNYAIAELQNKSPAFAQKYNAAISANITFKTGFGYVDSLDKLQQPFAAWVANEGWRIDNFDAALGNTVFGQTGQFVNASTNKSNSWRIYFYFVEA